MQFKRRPWGWYLTILDRKHFKVKLLFFRRGGEISKQKHNFRNELWLWIFGYGHKLFNNLGGGYEYEIVPVGTWHHYKSSNGRSLILEIQYGEKCCEEDIVRI